MSTKPHAPSDGERSFPEQVWALVRQVPWGRVVTYGTVARCLGRPRASRAVGYALFQLQDAEVPWHRVVNRHGGVSLGGHPGRAESQRQRLRAEGVHFGPSGHLDLKRFGWDPTVE